MKRQLTDQELLDQDKAILVVSLPLQLLGFGWLIVAGWLNDRKARRRS